MKSAYFQLVTVKRSELNSNHLRSVVSKLFKSSEMRGQHHPWDRITLVGGRHFSTSTLEDVLAPCLRWVPYGKEEQLVNFFFFFWNSTCVHGTAVIPHCRSFQSNYYQLPFAFTQEFFFSKLIIIYLVSRGSSNGFCSFILKPWIRKLQGST